MADEREDLSVARIHGYCDTVELRRSELLLGYHLQVDVDGRDDVLTRDGLDKLDLLDESAAAVDDNAPRALLSHQRAVVRALDPGLSDHIAGSRAFEFGKVRLKLRIRNLTDVAEHVTENRPERVDPLRLQRDVEFGMFVFVGLDPGAVCLGDVLLDDDRARLWRKRVVDLLPRPVGVDTQIVPNDGEELVEVLLPQIFAIEYEVECRATVDEDPPVAIQDVSASRRYRDLSNAVLVRLDEEGLVIDDLKDPEPNAEHEKEREHDVHHDREPRVEVLCFFVESGHQQTCHR